MQRFVDLSLLTSFLQSTGLPRIREKTINAVQNSSYPHLAVHLDLILFSFGYFVLLDWFIYYVLGNKLCSLASSKTGKSDKGLDELNQGGSLRTKWAHMVPSFVHALLVSTSAAYFWVSDVDGLSKTLQTRLFGYSPSIGNIFAFSTGYFLWDCCICIYHHSIYGPSFFLHDIMALIGLLSSFSDKYSMAYYTNRFLMFEISTIFIDFHWFFAKTGHDKTKKQKIADILGVAAYLLVRLLFGYYSSWLLMNDLYSWYKTGKSEVVIVCAATALQAITHTLNLYWFIKLARSAATPVPPKQKKA